MCLAKQFVAGKHLIYWQAGYRDLSGFMVELLSSLNAFEDVNLKLDQGLKHPKFHHVFRNRTSSSITPWHGGERMWIALTNFRKEWNFIFNKTGKRIFCLYNPKVFPAEYLLNQVCETQTAS